MQASPPPPAGAVPPAPRTHGMATTSVISGLLACCCPVVPAIIAIVCGVIALGEIRDHPNEYKGRETAIAGVVLGVGQLILVIVAVLVLVMLSANPDNITAFLETPPAEVFAAGNVPADGETFLQENGYLEADERIVLYYDDSFMEKFAALSVLTDRRVLTVFDGELEFIPLRDVQRVRYVPGSFVDDHVIYVHGDKGHTMNLIFTVGADVRGFAEQLADMVRSAGGPANLQVE